MSQRNFSSGKSVKAVVEHVRDGTTIRVLLVPDFIQVSQHKDSKHWCTIYPLYCANVLILLSCHQATE